MQYFTDGSGHVARVKAGVGLGRGFLTASPPETYNGRRKAWIASPSIEAELRFSGDWFPCTEDEAQVLVDKAKQGTIVHF
ncbi:hypothetical protein TUM20984_50030 [Mycobacterium antarcticum]|nr:hypothetical protein TUM20984_50030 [Mycolicibacterium sp. TUM20984]